MSNIALQTIKFPGLSDTYTIPQVDNTLTTTGAAADAKKTGDEISDIKNDLEAIPSGTYENMTVGNAEQLVSTQYVEDEVPYLFRTTGGSADVGNRAYIDSIVGGSVAWNQLVRDPYTTTIHDVTFTAGTNGQITINGTASEKVYLPVTDSQISVSGHVYYADKGSDNTSFSLYNDNGGILTGNANRRTIGKATANKTFYIRIDSGNTFTNVTAVPQVFDLTQMFGSTIADYIYSLEQATAGAGVSKLKSWGFFTDDYYAYSAPTMTHVSGLTSHDTVGFNQWDEEWEVGTYNNQGVPVTYNSEIRSKNYIRVVSGQAYYFETPKTLWITKYDSNYNCLGEISAINQTRTFDDSVAYIRFCTGSYGNTYHNDICINLSWSGYRDGQYESFVKHSYPLDSDLVLRGIPKLDASNELYYNGDTYEPDGTVTRKYGIVDLGTLGNWMEYNGYPGLFYLNVAPSGAKIPSTNVALPNIIASGYIAGISRDIGSSGHTRGEIALASNRIYVSNDTYSGNADGFRTAISGVYLVYELETPTTETADAYTSPQIVNDFGTEEFVTTGIIPVGHDTRYPANLRDKLQHLPDLAENDGTYLITQADKQMSLTPYSAPTGLPTAPTTDGTYTLQASVSSGTATYSWVSAT